LALAETVLQLVTPTIFFLAAKVEEQPVKLRYITNACLQKYLNLDSSKFWDPHAETAVCENAPFFSVRRGGDRRPTDWGRLTIVD
jgi:hypothetical protein